MKKQSNDNGVNIDDWATPDFVLDYIKKEFGNYFDPCPLKSNFNGLDMGWEPVNYINPPYSRKLKEQFINKALEESKKGAICVLLIPANTDTKIFHDVLVPNGVIKLIKKRIPFKGYDTKGNYVENKTGTSGSMLVIFGTTEKPNITTLEINSYNKDYTKNGVVSPNCKKPYGDECGYCYDCKRYQENLEKEE